LYSATISSIVRIKRYFFFLTFDVPENDPIPGIRLIAELNGSTKLDFDRFLGPPENSLLFGFDFIESFFRYCAAQTTTKSNTFQADNHDGRHI
jgi:hypothetical protein